MKFLIASLACIFSSAWLMHPRTGLVFEDRTGRVAESSIRQFGKNHPTVGNCHSKKTVTVSPAMGNLVFLNSSAEKGKTRKVICVDAKTEAQLGTGLPIENPQDPSLQQFRHPVLRPSTSRTPTRCVGHSTELSMCPHAWGKTLGKDLGEQGRPWFRGFTHCFRRSSDRSQ